ncbi:DMA protein, partial [Menura novaehollandiae]|nr:DMA protein [Menura novaehollandiae]
DPASHLLAEVLTCQPDTPSLDLSITLDEEQLFWFDFPGSHWTPQLPHLPPWPAGLETPPDILQEVQLCQELRKSLSQALSGFLPESRGIPVVSIFPVLPPFLGEPNTLVCLVENIFPPALDITWTLSGVPVTRGVTHSPYTPTSDLTFRRYSQIPIVPAVGDVHACVVTTQGDNATVVAYWVPPDTALDEGLDTALAGAAMALGIVLALLGVTLAMVARR